MGPFRVRRSTGTAAYEVFIQIIERQAWDEEMAQMKDVTYLDLCQPWFSSKA